MALPREEGLVAAENLMRQAIALAKQTPKGDVPVGAIIFGPDGEVLGRGTNRREADNDPLGHAEILAIREATSRSTLHDAWRLSNCTLVVTLEPCTMCAGALVGARIGTIIFGAYEPKTGAVGSIFDVVRDPHVLHPVAVRGGVLEEECKELLSDFFSELRDQNMENT